MLGLMGRDKNFCVQVRAQGNRKMESLLVKLSKEIWHGVIVIYRYQFSIKFTKTTGEGIGDALPQELIG
ncbi:unnamed protein product [Didymodactylos carnosus]|uniref:Uncharacterized protein n=1 Tax=Didymodactylos carnosus TaxID=1234261 RepID=A0A8S2HQK1_9BILA|nr:unnamed protein product [Didymodactylos carnosus]CAF3668587.1 unnamed protein product [Didymodactylos carnosus]